MASVSLFAAFCASAVLWALLSRWRIQRRANPHGLPYPPGPKPRFLIGNMKDIPRGDARVGWGALHKQYGDIVHLETLGLHFVTIFSWELANEVLHKRAAYAGRRGFTMLGDIMGWRNVMTFTNYGDRWRRYRKLTHASLNKSVVSQYWNAHEKQVRFYLKRLLDNPERFREDFRLAAGRGIIKATYGIDVESSDHEYISVPEKAMALLAKTAAQPPFSVDFIPLLRYLPEWFPGTAFHQLGKKSRKLVSDMVELPFQHAKRDIAAGVAEASITTSLLGEIGGDEEEEDIVKWTAGTMYIGGSDTTVSSMATFFLAMVLYPSAFKRAQEEIDSVIGKYQRLPEFDDREHLPYVNALIQEVFRWHPVLPVGVPHMNLEDDVVQGYFIPKGSMILASTWAISRDEKMFPQPDKFLPERWLTPNKDGQLPIDPALFVFGWGRRICPGIHFADASLFLMISSVIAMFDISKAIDADGNEITPEEDYTPVVVSNPQPFKCRITPRSEGARGVIESAWASVEN